LFWVPKYLKGIKRQNTNGLEMVLKEVWGKIEFSWQNENIVIWLALVPK
jgi:hypothetical protein